MASNDEILDPDGRPGLLVVSLAGSADIPDGVKHLAQIAFTPILGRQLRVPVISHPLALPVIARLLILVAQKRRDERPVLAASAHLVTYSRIIAMEQIVKAFNL